MKENKHKLGDRIVIPVEAIEFNVEGNTIWIHSKLGGTSLRIKCTGKIKIDQCQNSPISHSDILVNGDIDFCLAEDAE